MLTLTKDWWVLFLRGLLAIMFAAFTLARPDITLASLIPVFGAYAFADGVLHLVAAVRSGSGSWLALLVAGMFGIGTGLVTFFYPGLIALSLLYFIAFWSIACGVAEIIAAIRLSMEIEGEWRLALAGLFAVTFGIFLAAALGAGALGPLMVISSLCICGGEGSYVARLEASRRGSRDFCTPRLKTSEWRGSTGAA